MDLTGQFVLVLLYQGAIVADLSELSHPQALSNYDNGEATVDFAVSNGFGITEPSAVFHLSGWDLDYNPQQNIDFSLKASSLSDSGPHLEPDILGTVENQETYSPLVNLINIEDTGKDISTNKLIINSTNIDKSRKQSKYTHGLLKSLNLVLNEIHYQESRLDTEHRNPTVLSAIQPSPTDVFTRSFSKSTNSSRNIKTSQSSFSLLKNALQKSVVSKENRTSALDHSRRFRELTKRRKYSMNFVKRENINGSENVFDLTASNITFGITELQENISLGFIRNSKIPFVDIFGVSSINNYTHPSESQTAHQFVDEDLLNTLNYSDFKLERAPMINNNSNNHLLNTNIELNKGTSTMSRLKNSSSIISPNKTLSSPSFTYLGYLPVPTSSHPPTKESTLFSNGGTTRVTLSSSSMGPDNIHVPGVLPMPLTTTSLPRPTLSTLFSLKPTSTSDPWPVKLAAEIPGDLILGGLMMVHEREDSVTCGPIMPQGGIQALETMLYTLDVVNNMPDAPFTLGAHILDDCDKDTYGLEMAVDFIKGSISNIDDAEYHCNKTQIRKVISGVVGAASSVTSIQVANLLRLFKIPQVSFFSTSPELSNKQRFEYFTRTIPSDHHQVKAMVEIVRRLGWSYVSIIYEESNYGIKAFEELEVLLAKYEICIAVKEKLVKDSGVAEETAYDTIVLRLLTKPRARGAIIFGSDQEVAGLMRAVRRCNATGNFSWIGSDGWSARSLVWQGNEREVEGTLSVQPQANPVAGFDRYFLNLTVDNNHRNPWFIEFWEHHFQCRYPNSPRTPHNQRHTRMCTSREQLTVDNTVFENQLQFVSDAVMAFAVALRDMHRELCHGSLGLCEHMRPTKGPELLKYLRKVNFEGLSGDKFKFDSNGDGPARYNIIHFKQMSSGNYRWVKVGDYLDGELTLNMSDVQFRLGQSQPPESVCSLPCELGQAKQYVEGESCCWHCFNCTQYQVRHPLDETQCVMCPEGTVPDPSKQQCLNIPEVFLKAESAWAIGAMSLSATGIIITLLVVGVFLRHNTTPVVKAAGRELSYVLLTGILLCYSVTFALVLRPSNVVCGIQRFGTGFCFTVVYAALLTKTNRIARIFNAGKRTTKRPNFISPKSQLIICSGLVSVQVLINGIWMIVSPPRAIHHYPTREDNLLVCASYVNASYMIAFGYPILLILVCTVYAVLTRNIPEAFNESKHIGFTMYTTCVIWLAFVPLYFGTGHHMPLRITSMSVTISMSASVTLVCLFSPKLYIILVRPERNVRQSMMPSRHGLFKSGTAASVMVGAAPVAHTHQPFAQVLGQRECIALEINEDTKKHKKDKVQTSTRSTQTTTTTPIAITNKSPTLAKVNNVVNNISSFVENGPPLNL